MTCLSIEPYCDDQLRLTESNRRAAAGRTTAIGKVIVSETDPEKEARHQTVTLGGNVLLRKNEQVWNGNGPVSQRSGSTCHFGR
jgi:hypothetical protein